MSGRASISLFGISWVCISSLAGCASNQSLPPPVYVKPELPEWQPPEEKTDPLDGMDFEGGDWVEEPSETGPEDPPSGSEPAPPSDNEPPQDPGSASQLAPSPSGGSAPPEPSGPTPESKQTSPDRELNGAGRQPTEPGAGVLKVAPTEEKTGSGSRTPKSDPQ